MAVPIAHTPIPESDTNPPFDVTKKRAARSKQKTCQAAEMATKVPQLASRKLTATLQRLTTEFCREVLDGHAESGCSLWPAYAGKVPWLHGCGRTDLGAGHRCEHGHLPGPQHNSPSTPAVPATPATCPHQ